MTIISDNGVSKTWREGDWVYKQQPLFMTDNEIWCLTQMHPTGYVPLAEQVDDELIRLEYIEQTPLNEVDFEILALHFRAVATHLKFVGIRHGDLTDANILIRDSRPFIIDWSESRLTCDPRPDKRREGDEYWLNKTLEKMKRA